MKTVFVLLPLGITVRNFLYTGVLDRLASRDDVKVIAFVGEPEVVDDHQGAIQDIQFELLPPIPRYSMSKLLNRLLRVRFYKINSNPTLDSKWTTLKKTSQGSFLADTLVSQPLPRSERLYQWLRAFNDRQHHASSQVQELFARYRPSLVFSTHPTSMFEYDFLKHAASLGVTTVSMIRSWDVLTTKGYIPAPSDYYLVWNEIIKKELLQLYDVTDDIVGVTGIPQFDIYADTNDLPPREEFLLKQGLNPKKKTVLFATSPPWINPEEPEIIDRLAAALEDNNGDSIQVLARLHQLDPKERYQGIEHDNLAFQIPGETGGKIGDRRLLDPAYLTDLRDTLAHADVVVNTTSTMTIDAAALDKPVVNISFDLHNESPDRSVTRYFNSWIHIQHIVRSGASKLATSFPELLAYTNRYLEDPTLERDQRVHLCAMMCYRVDGGSGQRVVDHLFQALDRQPFLTADQLSHTLSS